MTDIVERLRDLKVDITASLLYEAADEIERLTARECRLCEARAAEIDRLTALLNPATSPGHELLAADVAYRRLEADIERLTALLREAVLYDSQIIHMESWWRKVRRALEPKP